MTWTSKPILWPTEEDTRTFGERLAGVLRAEDVVLLVGEIGAGKSFLARAIIRALCGEDTEVPSPTFTLVQCYDAGSVEIWHADLYRLGDPEEALELGLVDALETSLCLIEWPERLGMYTPKSALTVTLEATPSGHRAQLAGVPNWETRLQGLFDA